MIKNSYKTSNSHTQRNDWDGLTFEIQREDWFLNNQKRNSMVKRNVFKNWVLGQFTSIVVAASNQRWVIYINLVLFWLLYPVSILFR